MTNAIPPIHLRSDKHDIKYLEERYLPHDMNGKRKSFGHPEASKGKHAIRQEVTRKHSS